jgi:predicted RNA-binding protein with PIN domain
MLFLVDGYNLMYALGILLGKTTPRGLEAARLRFLEILSNGHGDESSLVTVVFDAKQAPLSLAAEQSYRGLHVLFAVTQDQADDLIMELIRQTSEPRKLTVVSDDRRIRTASQRRHCVTWSCDDYLDYLERRPTSSPHRSPAQEPGKPEPLSHDETLHWLIEFGGLDEPTE